MRALKLLLAVLLLPACAALTLTTWKAAQVGLGADGRAVLGPREPSSPAIPARGARRPAATVPRPEAVARHDGLAFAAGYALWLAVFALLPKPMRTYVLGHELTHALWALMLGARVGGLKVRPTGGQVRTSKINWFIVLAPYFFPFYAMLFLVLFFLGHAFWNLEPYFGVLLFLVGLGWSFHVTFTLMMLLSTRQPDVQSQGVLFSLVMIYGMNLLALLLTIALLAHPVRWADLAWSLGQDGWRAYAWTLDKLALLWHRLAAHAFRS